MPSRRRRLLSIGHSYCVALNRRLPEEIARVAGWDVTVVAPRFFFRETCGQCGSSRHRMVTASCRGFESTSVVIST